jgi:Endonuclease I
LLKFYFYPIYGATLSKKSKSFFFSMLPEICRWHRKDKVDSTEIFRSLAIARIQSNINPFIFDPSLTERCFCKTHTDIPPKIHIVNIFPNPSKGIFYIEIEDYKGPVIMKISDQSVKPLEIHHLMYSGLMSWRLGKGVWKMHIEFESSQHNTSTIIIQ